MVNKAELRQFIMQYFNDHELDDLCFDYYPDLLNQFTTGMTKSQKVIALIGHCERRSLSNHLLATLAGLRPAAYQDQFGAIPKRRPSDQTTWRDPNRIFLSHANQDAAFARQLAGDLHHNGFDIWMAPESIEPGERWVDAIERGLETSGIFVLVITSHAVNSKWVRDESNYAIALQNKDEMRLITLHVGEGQMPPMWSVRQHISFREEYDEGLRQLLAALRPDQISARPLAPPLETTPPDYSKTATAATASDVATPSKPAPEPAVILPETRPASRAPEQQRKQVTILFADVSGFTALSETLDVEIVAGIMNDLWALVDAAITDHGGRIDKHIGDAVMALWGAEVSREDDPERAVHGALAMQAAIDEFCTSHSVPLSMRIGLNTGPVLLGQVGRTAEVTAIGDAVNLASRLEHAAPVGGILISHNTYRHVRGVFDVVTQEPIAVKGKTEPVQTYVVLQAKPRVFRLGTRGVEGIETRMVGREAEMLILQSAYTDAIESSETRVVTVIGDAGVGKSRLLYEFDNWIELRPEDVYYFKGRGTPNTQNIPYSLFRDLFSYRFDIRDSDSASLALEKFQSGMAGHLEPDQAAITGQWLGFDFSASEAVVRLLGGTGFPETARAYLTRYFRKLLAGGPAVVFLEDIHWADDPSLELGLHLIEALSAAPMLVVALARPIFFERRPNWGSGEAAIQQIRLQPLSKQASRALVGEILQRVDDVPDSLRDLIIEAAEGNPFYVEELVKMLIDQGVIERDAPVEDPRGLPQTSGVWRVRTDKLAGLKVPPTLTGLLQARLDGLPRPEREALQRASVVGRLFWDDAVAELLEAEHKTVVPTLEAVRGRELIFRRERSAFAGADEYVFKHALLRDVAYETVLLKYRAEFHGKVARWLEESAGERLSEYLGLIAEHYVQAGEGLKAAELLERSAFEARKVGAWAEARQALERALAMREAAGETDSPAVTRVAIALGEALRILMDFEPAGTALERGLAGARLTGDRAAEAEALAYQGRLMHDLYRFDEAGALVEAALELGRTIEAPVRTNILYVGAVHAMSTGDPDRAESLATELLEGAQESGDLFGEMNALNILGIVAAYRRDLQRTEQFQNSILTLAQRSGHISYETLTLLNLSGTAYQRGDYAAAHALAMSGLELSRDLGEIRLTMFGLFNLALANFRLGDLDAARQETREVLSLARSFDARPMILGSLSLAGQILAVEGKPDQAMLLFGLVRIKLGLEDQLWIEEIDKELARLDLQAGQIEAGLAAGAALDFDAVVQEILDGKW